MKNIDIFTNRSDNYARARPAYAVKAADFIFAELADFNLPVADMGSGTGIFSKEAVLRGFETFGVEPNANMREKAEEALGSYDNFHSVAAPAEDSGIAGKSVGLVTAASAVHWFDISKFKSECKRILVPSAYVCLIINERKYDDFTECQHEICEKYCPAFSSVAHGAIKTRKAAQELFESEFEIKRFSHNLFYSCENFIARTLSSSYSLLPNEPGYGEYVKELTKLARTKITDEGTFSVANDTVVIWGKL